MALTLSFWFWHLDIRKFLTYLIYFGWYNEVDGEMMRHLVVDLSGYGHAAMTVPIINALRRNLPDLKLTIRTTVPSALLAERVEGSFEYITQLDFGMVMSEAMDVLPNESALAYWCIHSAWEERISAAAGKLASIKPSLILSNVSYLSLIAARKAGIPAVAMGSFNWADIFYYYCGHLQDAKSIREQMTDAYAAANIFLQPAPSMPMPSIRNGVAVGPVALVGRDRRIELRHRLGIDADKVVVLLAPCGITELPIVRWPRLGNLQFLMESIPEGAHPDVKISTGWGIPLIDLVRSCDVLIGKPGYHVVTEAACNGIPMLLIAREGWPENSSLREWLVQHGRTLMLSEEKLRAGDFLAEVEAVRAMSAPPTPDPNGIAEAAAILAGILG